MRVTALGLAIGVALLSPGAPALAETVICGRGARVEALPMSYLLHVEADQIRGSAYERVDWSAEGQDVTHSPEAPHLRDILAERSALLPGDARDLPYLIVLAGLERYPDGVLDSLTHGSESVLAARFLDAMDRNGMAVEAQLLRDAVALFPDWGDSPRERSEQVYPPQTNDEESSRLRIALTGLAESWPRDGRAEAAALRLIASDPRLSADYAARLAAVPDADRLYWLTGQLWRQCQSGWWLPEEADRQFFLMGAPQAALLMMESFLSESLSGSAYQYFSNSSGTMAPHLARVLDLRGLDQHAAAIRRGMAVFPTPYPRDTDSRNAALDELTPEQVEALGAVTEWAEDGVIEAEMIELARESGLLPEKP